MSGDYANKVIAAYFTTKNYEMAISLPLESFILKTVMSFLSSVTITSSYSSAVTCKREHQ